MRRLFLVLAAAAALLAAPAAPALADHVPPHEHFLTTGSGKVVQVAPRVCSVEEAAGGFHNFHGNVHTGTPGTTAFARPNNPVSGPTAVFC
jgi:hypothetical protein